VESFFYPYHLVIALITSVIFLVIVLSYRHYLKRKYKDAKNEKTKAQKREKYEHMFHMSSARTNQEEQPEEAPTRADAIALGSLIVTIAITGILPIMLNPLVDYSATLQENGTKLTIEIKNLGLGSANNVMSSVSAKNVSFSNFESEPFLANHFRANSSILGKGFFEISIMPPRSETFVSATLDPSRADVNAEMKVFLRSDERVGFHDTLITSIFYFLLGMAYILLLTYWVYWRRQLHKLEKSKIVVCVVAIAVAEIVVTAIYYYIYFPFPTIIDLPPVS
jgi:hypothetical protein